MDRRDVGRRNNQEGQFDDVGGAVYLGAAALLKTEELTKVIRRVGAILLLGGAGGYGG